MISGGDPRTDEAGRPSATFPVTASILTNGFAIWNNSVQLRNWTVPATFKPLLAARFDAAGTQLTPGYIVSHACYSLPTDDAHALVPWVFPPAEAIAAYADELPQTSQGAYPRPVPAALNTWAGVIEPIADPFMRTAYQHHTEVAVVAVILSLEASQPPVAPMTLGVPPTAPGSNVEAHTGGSFTVFADGTRCATFDVVTDATIELGSPDQPAACHSTGTILECVDALGRLYYQQFKFAAGTTERFINYGPPPTHTSRPHYICEYLRSQDLDGECTGIRQGSVTR